MFGALLFSSVEPIHAASATWSATPTDATWVNGSNWGGTAPGNNSSGATVSADVATFNTALSGTIGGSTNPIVIDSGRTISGITFGTTAGAYVIGATGGNTLYLSSGGTIQTSGTGTAAQTIAAPLTLGGNYTFTSGYTTAADMLTFTGAITGPTTVGTATITLNGSNTGNNSISGVIANGNTGTGALTGITKTGSGTWILTGANTYSGTTTVTGGILAFAGTGSSANSAIVDLNNNELLFNDVGNSTATVTRAASVTLGNTTNTNPGASASFVINNAGNTTATTDAITGSITLSNSGSGVSSMIFTGSSTTATVTLTAAGINQQPGAILNVTTSTLTLGTNAFFKLTNAPTQLGANGTAAAFTQSVVPYIWNSNNGLLTYDATNGLIVASTTGTAPTSGGSTLINYKGSGFALTGSGTTTINSLVDNSSNSTYSGSTATLAINSGVLYTSQPGAVISVGTLTLTNAGYIGAAGRTMSISSVITGTNGVTFFSNQGGGGATITLSGANTISGAAYAYNGANGLAVVLDNTLAMQNLDVDFTAGSVQFGDTATNLTTATFGSLGGSSNLNLTNAFSTKASVALTVGGDNNNSTYTGVIADGTVAGGRLTKTGTGTMTLTGVSTYTGATVISGNGAIDVGVNNALPTTGTLTLGEATGNTSGTLVLGTATAGFNQQLAAITTAGSSANNAVVGGGSATTSTLTIANTAADTFSGTIGGAGTNQNALAVVHSGSGTLTLSGSNTYTGTTTNSAGVLQLGSNSALGTGTFSSGGGASLDLNGFTLSNAIITNGNFSVITNTSATTGTVTSGFNLANAGSFTISDFTISGNNILWSGAIDRTNFVGTLTVNMNSGQALTLSGAGSGYTGMNYNVTGGSLALNMTNGSTFGGGTITLGSTSGLIGAESSGVANTVSTVISSTGSFTQSGAGETILSGANTYSGGTTLTTGTLALNNGAAGTSTSSAIGTGTLTIAGGSIDSTVSGITLGTNNVQKWNGDFTFVGSQNLNLGTGSVTLGGNRQVTITTSTLTEGGIIGDGGNAYSLTKAGNGTLILNGANTYTGGSVINAGTVQLGSSSALGTGSVQNAIGSTLDLNGQSFGNALVNTASGSFNGTITNSSATTATVSSGYNQAAAGSFNISDFTINGTGGINWSGAIDRTSFNGTITKSGTNTLTLSGAGTGYVGESYTVSTGALAFNMTNGSTFNSGTITNSSIVLGAETTGVTNTIASPINGTGSFTQSGAGTTILTATNGYTGTTTITTGTLQLGNGTTDGSISSSATIVDNGALNYDRSTGSSFSYGNAISGTGSVINSGAGKQVLTGTNTYAGGTSITAGILQFGKTLSMPATGTVTVSSGATVAVNAGGTGEWTTGTSGVGTIGGLFSGVGGQTGSVVSLASGSNVGIDTTDASGVLTYAGVISNSGVGLVKLGTGTLALSGANTFTGSTTVIAGTLDLANQLALQNSTLTSGGVTFDSSVGANAFTLGGLSGSGNIALQNTASTAIALTIGNNNTGTTYSGVLSAGGSLVKTGTGTSTLTGAETYTGATTINNGSLVFAGATGGNTTTGTYTVNGGSFVLDNTGAGNNDTNRLADNTTVTLSGGNFIYKGSDQASTNSTETFGLINGGGNSIVTDSFGGTNLSTLTIGGITHNTGNGTDLVNGSNLGKDSSGTASEGRIILTAAPTLVGTTNALTTGINSAAKNTKIVPFLVGEATQTTGGLGTATGTANTFLTYIAGSGLRPLNPTDEFTNNAITSGNNTYITSATTSSSTAAINSLVINGGNLTINDGTTLTDTSGALLFVTTNTIAPSGTTGALSFANNTEGQITVDSGATATISANITANGTNALTKSGLGTLILSGGNTYTGGTNLTEGLTKAGSNSALGSVNAQLAVNTGATFDMNGNNTAIGQLANGTNGGGTITDNGAAATFTFGNGNAGGAEGVTITDGTGVVSVVKNGSGTIQVTNTANTYSGGTTINGGLIRGSGSGSAIGSGTLTLNGGGLYIPSQGGVDTNYSNAIVVNSVAGDNLRTDQGVTFSGAISGTGTLSFVNGFSPTFNMTGSVSAFSGAFDLSQLNGAAVSFTNATNASNGNVAYTFGTDTNSSILQFGTATGQTITLGSLTGTGTNTVVRNVTNGTTDTFQIGALNQTTTYAGNIATNGTALANVDMVGTGTLTLSGVSTYTGSTTVSGGTLIAGSNAPSGAAGAFGNATTAITLGDASTTSNGWSTALLTGGAVTVGRTVNVTSNAANATIGGNTDNNSTFSGAISTAQSLNISQVLNTGSNALNITGGITDTASSGVQTMTFTGPGNVNVATNGISDGVLGGQAAVYVASGTTTLSASSTYTGSTTVSGGALIAGANAPSGSAGAFGNSASAITLGDANTITNSATPTVLTGGAYNIGRSLSITSNAVNGAIIGGNTDNNSTFSGLITTDANLTVSQVANTGANALTVSGGITGGSAGSPDLITFAGPGNINVTTTAISDGGDTLSTDITGGNTTFGVANTYTGSTMVDGGTLTLGINNAIGSSSALTVASSTTGTLAMSSFSDSVASFTLGTSNAAVAGTVTGTGTLSLSGAGNFALKNGTISAVLGGSSGLIKNTSNTVTLAGANTFTGNTSVTLGTLDLSNQNALQNSTVTSGGTGIVFDSSVGGHAFTLGGLSGSIGLALTDNGSNAVALSVGNNNAGNTYSGAMSGGGSFIKVGTGTETLSGTNSYTGSTTVSAGALNITGSTASAGNVGVSSGAALMGTGTTGLVTVASGGSIALQNGTIGTLHVGSLTIGSTGTASTMSFDIGSTLGNIDSISDTGALTLIGTGAGGTTITIGNATGVSSLTAGQYALITYAGALSGTYANLSLSSSSLDGKALSLSQGIIGGQNAIILTVGATATPTSYTLATTAGASRIMNGQSTTLTTTITNVGTGTADTLNYTGLGATATTVSNATTSGGPLANGGGTGSNSGQIFTGSVAGANTITPTGSGTNATLGGSATQTGTTTATVNVLNNRTETASSVALGRVLVNGTTGSQTTTITSPTGQDGSLTRTTLGGSAQASTVTNGTVTLASGTAYQFGGANDATNSTTRGVTGVFTTAGNQSGTANFTPTGEGLTGESVNPIGVAYTADAVNQRTFSVGTSPVALGRFLLTSTPTGSTAITSTGLNVVTGNASLGSFSSVNGLSLTTGDATAFNGATSSQTANYSVGGTASGAGNFSGSFSSTVSAELGSIAPVTVAVTGDAVNQRTFSVGTSPVALGRFLLTSTPTGSTAITSTGLNAVTGNASLGSFSSVNGLSLTTGDATAFNGAASSQTANYTVGGTASGAGNFSGSFSSTVSAELGSIAPVTVAVTGDAVNQRTFSVGTSPVALGRFLISGSPTGSTAITSTGLNAVTGNASLGSFSSVNGLSLTTGDATAFNGAASSQTANYSVGGTASSAGNFSGSFSSTVSAELGSIAPVTVAVTGDAVNQRTFSVGTSPVALGRFLITSSPTGSTAITSTGLNAVTGNASLGSFSSVNGLSLTTGDATAFNGATSSQTANYSIGGTASSAGSFSGNFSSTVSAELGSIAPVTVAVTGDAVNQRSFSVTGTPIALGRYLVGTTPSGSVAVSSTGLNDTTGNASLGAFNSVDGLTLTTTDPTAFNGATSSQTANYALGGTATTGNFSGTFSSTVSAEFGSIAPVTVAITADAVNQRSFSVGTSPVALGRFLISSSPTGSTAITSTGLNNVTANASLGSFSSVNGLSLTTGDATAFNGATSSQTANYSVGGTASSAGSFSGSFSSTVGAELGSIAPVTVAVTGDAVNQRTFSVGTSPVALGRFLISSSPTGSTAITSTGLNDTTGNASLGSFSSVNGLNLTTGDSTAFNGGTSSQTANYSVGGTAASAGSFSGSFSSTVGAELGSIAPVTVAVTGDAVNQRSFSVGTSPVALGRFLITSSPTGSTAVTSTGLNDVTGNASLGSFSSVNGLSLTTGDSTAFNGATSSQTANYSVGGTASSAGSFSGSFSSTVGAELGSIAPVTVAVTGDAVNQRAFSVGTSPVALGRFLITSSPTGSTAITSTGLNDTTGNASLGSFSSVNGLSLTTGDSTAFNGGSSSQTANYAVGGTAASAGSFSGSFSSTVGAELGSIAPVTVAVTGDAVNQRSFSVTGTPVALGRYLVGTTPSGSVAVSSTGLNDTTGNASLGAFNSVDGLTLTTTDPTAFNGATSSQTATYALGGTATTGNFSGTFSSTVTAELGSIAPVTVAITADAVNQRTFSVSTSPVALGRFIATATPSGSTSVTSTGLNDVTANASLGTFSTVNGLGLTTGDSTTFNGASSSQTANYAVNGTASGLGSFSGTFSSTVSAELGSIAPVTVAVTGDAVTQRVVNTGAVTDLGFVHSGAAVSATANAFSSTGTHDTTTDVTVAGGDGTTTSNGVTLSGSSTSFNGPNGSSINGSTQTFGGNLTSGSGGTTTGSFNLGVTGEGLTGEGSYSDVNVAYTSFVYTGQGVWNTNGGGSWGAVSETPANWTANGGTPGLDANFTSTDSAFFGSVTTSGTANVTLDGDNPSLNAITFNNGSASYNIGQGTGTGSITLNGGLADATVTNLGGIHEISAPVHLATSADINVSSGQQLTLSGTLSGPGGLNTTTGSGTTIITGDNSYAGGTAVNAGVLRLSNSSGSATGSGALSVGAGAVLAGSGTSNSSGLSITGDSSTRATVLVGYNNGLDTNTTNVMTLTAPTASLGSARLEFNINANTPGQGTELAIANTAVTFNTVGTLNTQLALNIEGNSFIAAFTPYVLVAGTGTTIMGTGTSALTATATSGQFAGIDTFINAKGQNQIVTGSTQNLQLTFNDPAQAAYYAQSYLFIVNNDGVDDIEVEVVPEPGTWALMLGGLALLVFWQRRKNRS